MAEPVVVTYWVRHGETALNSAGKFRGASNPPLNANGRKDAQDLASYFEPIKLAAIFYSSKKRSTETAETIASKHKDIECFGTDSLWAWNVGMFSGKDKSPENLEKIKHYIDNPDEPIPQGESLNGFKARIRPCIKEAAEIADRRGLPTLCVVHSSVIHEVGSYISGNHTACLVEPGGVCAVYFDNGKLVAKPILKPLTTEERHHADTIS